MEELRAQIQTTVRSLEDKKRLLESHRAQYDKLRHKLATYSGLSPSDAPTLPIQLNSKAIVTGQVIDPTKVLVFLGCEYFVERTPREAGELVHRKLEYLGGTIREFERRIAEAHGTLKKLGELEAQEPLGELGGDPAQFMDIREELDDDGNVISSSVVPQGAALAQGVDPERPHSNPESLQAGTEHPQAGTERPQAGTERPQAGTERPQAGTERPHAGTEQLGGSPAKIEDLEAFPAEGSPVKGSQPRIEELGDSQPKPEQQGGYTEPKIQELDPEEHSGPVADTQFDKLFKKMNIREVEEEEAYPNEPAIDPEDILQLQIISDELDDDEYDDYDEEEEDDDDWDFVNNDSLIPSTYKDLFTKELEKLRSKAAPASKQDEEPQELPDKKKKVSFAKELQIKEVENISDELKPVSQFKQQVQSTFEEIVGDIVESGDSAVMQQQDLSQEKPKKSKFKSRMSMNRSGVGLGAPHSSHSGTGDSHSGTASSHTVTASPVISDIKEAEPPEPPAKQSKFKARMQGNSAPAKGCGETASSGKANTGGSEPQVIIPFDANELEVENNIDFESIRAYLNEEEDEEDVNLQTDFGIFTPEELQEELDELEGAQDENVLADQIVENEDTEDPEYIINETQLRHEYQTLRSKMLQKYNTTSDNDSHIIFEDDKSKELEPIDEFGNPIKQSKFRKSLKR